MRHLSGTRAPFSKLAAVPNSCRVFLPEPRQRDYTGACGVPSRVGVSAADYKPRIHWLIVVLVRDASVGWCGWRTAPICCRRYDVGVCICDCD